MKAVLLWRLSQFVEWPPRSFTTPDSPLVVGVLGRNPFGSALEVAVKGQSVRRRSIAVQYYRTVTEVEVCHILFISGSEASRVTEILHAMQARSTLTVSDVDDFTAAGGMVRFVTKGSRVTLSVNLDAARAGDLVISSKLLRFAEIAGAGP